MRSDKSIDLLLINPGNRKQNYQNLGAGLAAIEPPIWAGLIAAFVRQHGFRVAILDANAGGWDPTDTADKIAAADPLLAAVVVYGQNPSASTMVMPAAGAICREVKSRYPEVQVLLVGGHVAALPEHTFLTEACDFVCSGEGFYTVLELLKALKASPLCLEKVHGLVYRAGGGPVVHTPPAPLLQDLDREIPALAWDFLPMDTYRAHNWHCFAHLPERQPYAALYTSLGCPFHCDFCCIQAPFKSGEAALGLPEKVNSYRCFHPDSIIAQIDTLVNDYGVCNIKFADEIFVLNKKHVIGICDRIIDRGYDLNIWAYVRVDSWTEEMLSKMKQAGINWLCLGIESGSERVRQDVHKQYAPEKLLRTVEKINAAGIYIIANYLFGLPEDDLDSMEETLQLAMALNCEFANFYSAMAYPGSRLYQRAVEEKLPLPTSWTGYSQHAYDTLPLPTKYLPGTEVLRFRDQAFQRYFSNPDYLVKIERIFGGHVAEHVREMTAKKLPRKYL